MQNKDVPSHNGYGNTFGKSQVRGGHPDRYPILFVILIGILMFVVDAVVVSIALPTITANFHASVALTQWTITAYLITITSLLLICGRISECVGKSRMFLAGITLFTLSSLGCGISTSLSMLILFRIFQAIGGAMAFSISAAIIFQTFPKGELGRAMGYIGSTVAIGSIAGPILGGYAVDFMGWQYIFLINVPIGIALLLLAWRYLRIDEIRQGRLEMDWIGAGTMIIFMVALMLFLGELASSISLSMKAMAYALVFSGGFLAFIQKEKRYAQPLLDLSVFNNLRFTMPGVSMILFFICSFMMVIAGPFFLQGAMELSPSQVGTIYLIVPAIVVIGSPIAGWLYDRYHYRYHAAIGLLIMVSAFMLMSYMSRRMDLVHYILAYIPMGIGTALFQSPNNAEIMSALPPEKVGMASSLTATLRNLGMALGTSISGVLLSWQLAQVGYYGLIQNASPEMLSIAISNIIFIAGTVCLIGAVASLIGNRKTKCSCTAHLPFPNFKKGLGR